MAEQYQINVYEPKDFASVVSKLIDLFIYSRYIQPISKKIIKTLVRKQDTLWNSFAKNYFIRKLFSKDI